MNNPCSQCLELDYCQEGKYGIPCIRKVMFEEFVTRIRNDILDKTARNREQKEGETDERNQGERQV